MEEIFKEIPGYIGYEVSNLGRVKSVARTINFAHKKSQKEHLRKLEEKFLKIHINGRTGYKFVQLHGNQKMKNVALHKAIADTFLVKPNKDFVVNHKDGNKHNNGIENLEFISNADNHRHAALTGLKASGERAGSVKLNKHCVYAIRGLLELGWKRSAISSLFKVSIQCVSDIKNAKSWHHDTNQEK